MTTARPVPPVHELELVDATLFVEAMSRAANGVNVVTTHGLAGCDGITVSSACSVTADPPSLLACIQMSSPAAAAIEHNGVFCLNVVAAGQTRVADAFASRIDGLEDRFSIADWGTMVTGCPVLEGAAAAFDCKVDHMLTEGTHRIFIARVVAALAGETSPLVYGRRAYARIQWD
jgi:flavin reductase (DIM6/NTAB) family NADH-FMN oxidoreductase RutF